MGGPDVPTCAGEDTEMEISLAKKRTGWLEGGFEGSDVMDGTVRWGLMVVTPRDFVAV